MKQSNTTYEGEHGAIIIEASICLPIFMFFMITLLSITKIAYTQAVVAVSLDRTAKQMSEYAHVYHALGIDGVLTGSGGKSSEVFDKVSEYLGKIGDLFGSDTLNEMGESIAGDSLTEYGLHFLGKEAAERMLKDNILGKSWSSREEFERFKKTFHIVSDFSWGDSNIFEDGSNKLYLIVDYDIEVIKLFSINKTFHMKHCSYAVAWFGR